MRPLLIDTATASDDAVALIMALRSPAVRVVAITVVAGNVPVDVGTRNALLTVGLCGAALPVHAGAAAPLLRPLDEMVGWQLSRFDAVIDAADIVALESLGTPLADFAVRCNRTAAQACALQTGQLGIALPDPVAMAIALQPELCLEHSDCAVEIETGSALTRGMTIVDRLGVAGDPRNRTAWADAASRRHRICWRLDVPGWKAALRRALAD